MKNQQSTINSLEVLINSIEETILKVDEIFKPYEKVMQHLEEIQKIERTYEIETGIDFDSTLSDTLKSCVLDSPNFQQIDTCFSDLISELEKLVKVDGNQKNQTKEKYLDVVCNIKNQFSVDLEEDLFEIKGQLIKTINNLKNIGI